MRQILSYILLFSTLVAISCKQNKKGNLNLTDQETTRLKQKSDKLTGQLLFNSILDTIMLKHLDISTLTKSKWIFTPFENCSSSYRFTENGNGEIFNCEMDLKSDINYKILKDTLYIEEFDIPTEDNPDHKTFKLRDDKYVFNGKSLIMIGSKLYNMTGISWTPDIEIVVEYKKQ